MLEKGWVKVHRKMLSNPVMTKPNYLGIWIYLLLNANTQEKTIIWNNKPFTIKQGSLITSISKIAEYFDLSTGTVSYVLNFLEVERMIERNSTKRFTVVTILNWSEYQKVERTVENKLKTNEKQIENKLKHSKKDKKDKKDKKKSENKKALDLEDIKKISHALEVAPDDVRRTYEKILDYEESTGKSYKSYPASVRNWLRRDIQSGKLKKQKVIKL